MFLKKNFLKRRKYHPAWEYRSTWEVSLSLKGLFLAKRHLIMRVRIGKCVRN